MSNENSQELILLRKCLDAELQLMDANFELDKLECKLINTREFKSLTCDYLRRGYLGSKTEKERELVLKLQKKVMSLKIDIDIERSKHADPYYRNN